MASTSSSTPGTTVQEFSIRVPKNPKKSYHVMRFNSSVNVDFTKWSQVKMEREDNTKEMAGAEEDQPKFGAGSEFGRQAREEARRKKQGIISKQYKPEDQPWMLKVGGKTGRKYKGKRGGGVSENAAYYIFTQAASGIIEAFPVREWYNFQPIDRYKALSAEEAEEEFGRRDRQVNYFSLMMRKRLRGETDEDGEEREEKKAKGKAKAKKGELKISEMEDWIASSDSSETEEEGEEKGEQPPKKKVKKEEAGKKKKKAKRDVDDEAFEESDDGDVEGREMDYISDSSESVSDHETKVAKELKGVEEEAALRKLLSSGEEDEEEEENEEKEEEKKKEEERKKEEELPALADEGKDKKGKKEKEKEKKKEEPAALTLSSDSSDSEQPPPPKPQPAEVAKEGEKEGESVAAKKPRKDPPAPSGDQGITEEAVRRYLMRKPMTTIELLQKFKGKKTKLTSEHLVNVMTQLLKRINPVKQIIKGKMYLSIKP